MGEDLRRGQTAPLSTPPQNNTPNNTFVSRREDPHGAMLLVDRARGTYGSDQPQEGQGHVKRIEYPDFDHSAPNQSRPNQKGPERVAGDLRAFFRQS